MTFPEPIWPVRPHSDVVPATLTVVNRLAITSFLLSLAEVGAGLASFGAARTAATTGNVSVWWSLYVANLVASVSVILTASMALRRTKQHAHPLVRTGYAQAGLGIGIVCLILLICGGAPFGLVFTACAQGHCR